MDVVEFVGLAGKQYFVEVDDGKENFVEVAGKEYFVPDNVAVNDPAAGRGVVAVVGGVDIESGEDYTIAG